MTFEEFMQRKRQGTLPRITKTSRYGIPYVARTAGERKGV